MIYKDFQNLRLPMLGFGSMRLPLLPGGGDGDVDEAAVAEMVALAMERGANYFDTAYGYHNGNSERVMGRVLSRYPRESWLLASKFPGYDVSNIRPDRVEAIFEEQLEKCGVDYFDFYLFHNVYERNVGPYLDPDNRVLEYLLRQKEAGRIRHLGFSAHGSLAVIQRFLDAYGEYMEFGQLQLNYLDWDFQGARAKAEELNRRHIPIWVMEPLRGGRLARLSDGDAARLAVLRPEESMPGWAFRFLQGVPGVTMVLSGMSSLEQLRANLDTFETDRPLSEAEKAALLDVAAGMVREQVLPCTACRYCCDGCPMGLDIPMLLKLYNEAKFSPNFNIGMRVEALPEDKRPAACVGCGQCARVCPQNIDIPAALADLNEVLKKIPSWADICRQREEAARRAREAK